MCRNALILLSLAMVCRAADPAGRLFEQGLRAERAGDRLHALLLYIRAAELDPANPQILAHRDALQGSIQFAPATPFAPAVPLPPAVPPASDAPTPPPAAAFAFDPTPPSREMLPPVSLQPLPGKRTFDIQGPADIVITQVARDFGIQTVFEPGYQPSPLTFRTGELTMEEAFRALEAAANSLIFPISQHVALVARDNPQRRADSTPVMEASIPIPERTSVQEAQELVTAVQQALELRRVLVDPLRRMVVIRDIASKVVAARELFSQLSRLRAQVEIEVELMTVTKTSSLAIGLSLPTTVPIVNFGNILHSTPSVGTFTKFLAFGGGQTLFGLGITDALTFATLSRASAQTVLRTQMTVVDGMPAQMLVGDHYPIQTVAYIGDTSGPGQVYTPPPSTTFEDLGLTLKITPTVHEHGEISLDVDAQFKVLGTGGSNGIPDVQQRKFQSKVRLASNEWAVLAGLTQETNAFTTTGIAFFSRIPLLGYLFRTDTTDKDSDRTLIVIKPRVVNLPPWEEPTPTLWTGTDGKPLSIY